MLRRHATVAAAVLVLIPSLLTLPGCGGGNGQLKVTISSADATAYKPGDPKSYAAYTPGNTATFTIEVDNVGPGNVTGVTVHVTLPGSFKYRSTQSVTATGATRTQPVDAEVNSGSPIFGLWTLDPPGSAGGTAPTTVAITFLADVEGRPGTVPVQAYAVGDATTSQSNADPYPVIVGASAHLSALVNVSPTTVKRGGTVTYQVRVINDGTGNATDVGVLVTLPSPLTFAGSTTPFAGNGSRNGGMDPYRNTVEVYYDGFLLPPLSNGGPGFVVVVFKATVGAGAVPATYPVDAQLTDDSGDTFSLHAVAPLTITA
jgi:uncharacterized repeat protein (TIGR01451 family)